MAKEICDIRELLYKQYNSDNLFNRMDIIVRYLAIEEYYGKNNYGFKLYKKMQDMRKLYVETPIKHNNDRFKNLIKNIEENGFNTESYIQVNENMNLLDGSHRFACALYFNVNKMPIEIIGKKRNVKYCIDWFKESGFTEKEINIIENKRKEIFKEYNMFFVATLWSPVQKYFDEITNEFKKKFNVLSTKDYEFKNKNEFNATVKGLYAVDDIAKWKIEEKLKHMKPYDKNIRVIEFDIGNPDYRLKKNNKEISKKVELIKKKYREKYKTKIDNYFHDIIIHIGDNYEHTEHMVKILEKDLSIKDFLISISNFNYALTKIDVPYMPKSFPKTFPLNKDMDILCNKKDFEKICNTAIDFSKQYSAKYEIKNIKDKDKYRIRFELNGFLIYQIDISCFLDGLEYDFIDNAINHRIKYNKFYILNINDELEIRINEYKKNPKKKHHLQYIEKHGRTDTIGFI